MNPLKFEASSKPINVGIVWQVKTNLRSERVDEIMACNGMADPR